MPGFLRLMSEISHAVAIFEAGIAVSLSVLTTIARMLQQRTGNSGWVDTIWRSLGLVGAGSALWPIGAAAPDARQWLVAAARCTLRTAGIADELRYAVFARELRR